MTASGTGSTDGRAANWAVVGAVIVSVVSLMISCQSSQSQLDQSGKGQIADRFSNTVELLNSDEVGKRLGAIYALEQIAEDSTEYRNAVKNALAGFVRVSSRQLGPSCTTAGLAEFPDIAAAVDILADRITDGTSADTPGKWHSDAKSFIDLSGGCLHGTNLEHSRLNYSRLNGADMANSAFDGAHLRYARFGSSGSEIMKSGSDYVAYVESISKGNVNVGSASFRQTDLSFADLSTMWVRRSCGPRPSLWFNDAILSGAKMWQSTIPDAIFAGANMDGMTITASSFVGSEFDKKTSLRNVTVHKWINFEQADMKGVDLTGLTFANPLLGQPWPKINFRNANLRGADLRGLNLADADFSGADLRDARLDSSDQLKGARWDGWTLWPDNVKPATAPAIVPLQPPPRKPDVAVPNRGQNPPSGPSPNLEDQRVTVETNEEGGVRIEIAPESASQQDRGGRPPDYGAPEPTSPGSQSGDYGDANPPYGSSLPYYYNGGYHYTSSTYYSNYSSLNYVTSSEMFTAC